MIAFSLARSSGCEDTELYQVLNYRTWHVFPFSVAMCKIQLIAYTETWNKDQINTTLCKTITKGDSEKEKIREGSKKKDNKERERETNIRRERQKTNNIERRKEKKKGTRYSMS